MDAGPGPGGRRPAVGCEQGPPASSVLGRTAGNEVFAMRSKCSLNGTTEQNLLSWDLCLKQIS